MLMLQYNQQMDFFNKYRDLFGVNHQTSIPSSRLSINNNLFIDKPFIPTYTQSHSINSKLRALKKDYNQLEEQITDFDTKIKTPKRLNSRKGRELREAREIDMNGRNFNSSFSKHQTKDPLQDKKGSWLRDEQKNLLKNSQIDHVFNHQIYENQPRVKNIRQSNIPKAQNFLFGSQQNQLPPRRPQRQKNRQKHGGQHHSSHSLDNLQRNREYGRQQVNVIKNDRNVVNNKKQVVTRAVAQQRRDQSKRNLRSRRQKLGHLLKTSW